MEDIKERLMKIKALADRGERNEADCARSKLMFLLEKYGLKIEDLDTNGMSIRKFKYEDKLTMTLLSICIDNVIGYDRLAAANYSPSKKFVLVEMTAYEFAEVSYRYEWYCDDYAKEKEKVLSKLNDAYIIKRHLHFSKSEDKGSDDNELSPEYQKRIDEAIVFCSQLSDNSPTKEIENR